MRISPGDPPPWYVHGRSWTEVVRQVLAEGPAGRHVDHLGPAADAEHGEAAGDAVDLETITLSTSSGRSAASASATLPPADQPATPTGPSPRCSRSCAAATAIIVRALRRATTPP